MISNNRSKPAQPQIRKVWKTIRGGIEKRGKSDGGTASEEILGKTVFRLKMDASELELAKAWGDGESDRSDFALATLNILHAQSSEGR